MTGLAADGTADDERPTQLTGMVLPKSLNPMIGAEKGEWVPNGVSVFFQPTRLFNRSFEHPRGGSYRFVKTIKGNIVAGMQVMSRTGKGGVVANVYCLPAFRRQGHSSELLAVARERLGKVEFSDDRSFEGNAWVVAQETTAPGRQLCASPSVPGL